MWHSVANLDFLVSFLSVLISNIMLTINFSYAILTFSFLFSSGVSPPSFLNGIRTFVISFFDCSSQKVSPCFLSISYASFTLLGTSILNLYYLCQYWDVTFKNIISQRLSLTLTNQLKVGISLVAFSMAYSENSTGLRCLNSSTGTQSNQSVLKFQQYISTMSCPFGCIFPLIDFIKQFTFVVLLPPLLLYVTLVSTW